MAKPKNEEAAKRIERCAFGILLDHGYGSMSHQAISDATGYSRAFIQRYLPKKEDAIRGFIARLLACMDEWVETEIAPNDPYEAMALTGQLYFEFLSTEWVKPLALDLLKNRDLSNVIITSNLEYQQRHRPVEDDASTSEDLFRIIGGAYEVVYMCLKSGLPVDAASESLGIVTAFSEVAGDNDSNALKHLEAKMLDSETAKSSIKQIIDNLLNSYD